MAKPQAKRGCVRCGNPRYMAGIYCRPCRIYCILATVNDHEERVRRMKKKDA